MIHGVVSVYFLRAAAELEIHNLTGGTGNFSLLHYVQSGSGAHPASIQWVLGALSLGESGWGVRLTTHHLLMPRSRNVWRYTSTPPLHLHYVVLA
jgi:hypothetical protein